MPLHSADNISRASGGGQALLLPFFRLLLRVLVPVAVAEPFLRLDFDFDFGALALTMSYD